MIRYTGREMGNLMSLRLEGEMIILHRLCVLETGKKTFGCVGAKCQMRKPLLPHEGQ